MAFEEIPWKLMWRHEAAKRFDGGWFEMVEKDGSTMVTFSYYQKYLWPLILFLTLSVITVIHGDYYGPVFFLVFLGIAISVNLLILRGAAIDLLNRIAQSGNDDHSGKSYQPVVKSDFS